MKIGDIFKGMTAEQREVYLDAIDMMSEDKYDLDIYIEIARHILHYGDITIGGIDCIIKKLS